MMQEILTKSGAVLHIDTDVRAQVLMLDVALTAFGGIAVSMELS